MGTAHWESTVIKENNSKLIRGDVHSNNNSNNNSNNGGRTNSDEGVKMTAARQRRQDDSGKIETAMKKKEASS